MPTKTSITTKRLKILQGKLSLRDFAKKVDMGQSTLHNYLMGRELRETAIKKIVAGTGCTSDWLLDLDDEKPENLGVMLMAYKMEMRGMAKQIRDFMHAFGD
jgi:hypothetical protein